MGKLAFAGGGASAPSKSRLPKGYTELSYIQSNGTQYIDTGFKHNQNTRIVMDAQVVAKPSSHAWLFEGRDSTSSNAKSLMLLSGSNWYGYYNTSTTRKKIAGVGVLDRLAVDYNKNVLTVNGTSYTWTEETFQSATNLVFFASNTNGGISAYVSARMYSCQIYDNGVLVRDFVPCLSDADGIGLYDLIGGKFYGNAGTGAFIGSEVA